MPATPAVAYSTAAFRRERERDWTAFESLVDRLERGSVNRLSDDDLLALPRYYRATLSSLSIARATSLDAALVDYLESLAMRGYFLLYGVRESRARRVAEFFRSGWPSAVRALWIETLVIGVLLALAAVVSYWLVRMDPSWFAAFIDPELVDSAERIRQDFELAQMGPSVTQNWERFMSGPVDESWSSASSHDGSPAAARRRVAAALRDLGPGLGDVVLRVCCYLEGIEAAEQRMGWAARSGKIVLRIALQRLARHYLETYGRGGPMIG